MRTRIVLMMALLLVGGLFAGAAFAQNGDLIDLTTDQECWFTDNITEAGLSEALLYPSMAQSLYGFEMSGGAGLSDGGAGKVAKACTTNGGREGCGSCWEGSLPGRVAYVEVWCLGRRVWRIEACGAC